MPGRPRRRHGSRQPRRAQSMKGREFITGLCGPRAGRHGIRSVGSPYWRAPAPKPRSSRAPGSITSQRSAVVEAIPSLRLVARPGLCAGTVIPRNAPCAPPLRAVYPNLAIGALGCTRLRGWCRDRRLEFRFGRRATRGWRVWIDQGNSCNRQLERRNRLRNPCRQGGLPYLTNAPGTYASKPELEARRGLQQGIQTKSQTCPNGQ
jgi:hypothetical protein